MEGTMYNVLLVCGDEINMSSRTDLRENILLITKNGAPFQIGLIQVHNLESAKNLINNSMFDVLVIDSKLTSNISQLKGVTKMPPLFFLNNTELEQVFVP